MTVQLIITQTKDTCYLSRAACYFYVYQMWKACVAAYRRGVKEANPDNQRRSGVQSNVVWWSIESDMDTGLYRI